MPINRIFRDYLAVYGNAARQRTNRHAHRNAAKQCGEIFVETTVERLRRRRAFQERAKFLTEYYCL